MSRKILILTGDAGDSYEALYAYHRFCEAMWHAVIAAPSRRRLHMVIHDTEPGWETYVERQGFSLEPVLIDSGDEDHRELGTRRRQSAPQVDPRHALELDIENQAR